MRDSLEFLNTNSAAVTALAAVASAVFTGALVFLTGRYVRATNDLLIENRRQAQVARGQDAKSLEEKGRRLQILGRRINLLVSEVLSHRGNYEALRRMPLWTEDEIQSLETLCTQLSWVEVDDATRLIWALRDVRNRIVAARETDEFYSGDNPLFLAALGGSEFFSITERAWGHLQRILSHPEGKAESPSEAS